MTRRGRQCNNKIVVVLVVVVGLHCFSVVALSITTFNVLASVHRSVVVPPSIIANNNNDDMDWRESDRDEWWIPRAEQLAEFVANKLISSDIILLQEWWNRDEFEDIFDFHTKHLFDRATERRPGLSPNNNKPREDGMAVLVKKHGAFELASSHSVSTGPQRIAQIVHCRERNGDQRSVIIGNTHLSFPGGPCPIKNKRKQTLEAHIVARAVTREGRRHIQQQQHENKRTTQQHFELIAGDFNSNSLSMAATTLEKSPHHFVNCLSASSEQALTSIGGKINLGVTHRNHLGQDVSVDHIMARLVQHQHFKKNKNHELGIDSIGEKRGYSDPSSRMGYFDSWGTRLVDYKKWDTCLEGESILSDHRPVTADFYWPSSSKSSSSSNLESFTTSTSATMFDQTNATLHPLQSPWNS